MYKNIINEFIEEKKYYKLNNLIGIVLYGSYATKTYNKSSDIDLMVIFDNSYQNKIKGHRKINNIDIEYFEQNIDDIISRMDKDYLNYDKTIYSIFNKCEIIYEKDHCIRNLIEYVRKSNKKTFPKISLEEIKYQTMSIYKKIERLDKIQTRPDFYYYYYLTLNKLIKFYGNLKGYSNISEYKRYTLYTNKNIQIALSQEIPSSDIVKLYLNSLKVLNTEDAIKKIKKFYNYIIEKEKIDINFENIEININNKNY